HKFYFNLDTPGGNRLLMQRYAENSAEFIRIIGYREFIQTLLFQSKKGIDLFFSRSDVWLQKLEKTRTSNNSMLAAFAEIHLYRAVLASQFSDYKASAIDLVASYKAVAKSGSELSTPDRNKLSGILGVLFQQIPDQYGKYLWIFGIRSSGLSGYNGLERYYTTALPGSIERMEGYLLMITALKEFSQDPAAAWNFIRAEGKPMLENPLIRYQSALAALKAGDCDSAVKLLDSQANGNVLPAFPYWTYQLGRCKLYQNDPVASVYFERFLKNPGGDNYRHTALLMAGWSYLLHGQSDKASEYFHRIKNLPAPFTVYDKQALNEVGSDRIPDPELLKVRLLFDGGYYDKCLEICEVLILSGIYHDREDGELQYRKARCEQRMGLISRAINSFLGVIDRADRIRSYIVPNSALQLGNLYKKSGQFDLARKYYKLSLDLNKYGYRDGINRQAQAALRELGK
ncbi:MAG: tetratricopeptide repeat protein, partial [Bacteroidia bacterium]|nr:tetratricopeptide repeat protein [Bacteroidia bacterium]